MDQIGSAFVALAVQMAASDAPIDDLFGIMRFYSRTACIHTILPSLLPLFSLSRHGRKYWKANVEWHFISKTSIVAAGFSLQFHLGAVLFHILFSFYLFFFFNNQSIWAVAWLRVNLRLLAGDVIDVRHLRDVILRPEIALGSISTTPMYNILHSRAKTASIWSTPIYSMPRTGFESNWLIHPNKCHSLLTTV